MRIFDKEQKLIKIICNQCGTSEDVDGGLMKKEFVSVEKESESADKTQVGIQITFLKDGQKRYLSMIQPWGKEGIWVPAEAKEGK